MDVHHFRCVSDPGQTDTDVQLLTSIHTSGKGRRSRVNRSYWRNASLQRPTSERASPTATPTASRFSRDQEHLAHFYKHLMFNGVQLFTLSEGWISELHIGFGGTMGALYVRQLSEKTHRGLRGRVEAGKSGGGITYGYDMVRTPKPDGTFDAGERQINESEAQIVRRIFEAYAGGMPPRKIVFMLNQEGIPGPRGKGWGA
ncbi:MAG: hypothetical protein C0519_01315 [Hyphomicrobium sp.]|nr:hypothetical protein [Hyphomicrobium sp.]PPD09563.1 MAG: hypothetical protein CTY28_01785 [Hyphomicrobium sp.]